MGIVNCRTRYQLLETINHAKFRVYGSFDWVSHSPTPMSDLEVRLDRGALLISLLWKSRLAMLGEVSMKPAEALDLPRAVTPPRENVCGVDGCLAVRH